MPIPTDEFLSKQRLLVISPHPDDESYGCAGTIARMKDLGAKVFVMVVSAGDLRHFSEGSPFVTCETREKEFQAAMEYLRVDDFEILYPDTEKHQRLDVLPRREMIEQFEQKARLSMEKVEPTIVALPAISYNQDHEAVFRAGFTACRPAPAPRKGVPPIVLAYDNTALFWSMEREKFHPNFYVDITDYLEHKLKALSLHESQRKGSLHHASIENVEYTARTRGREVSVEAAEGYMCLRFSL
ncbi:MAG: PIG-L family deacetylase [Planctomycetota bacterium]|nr:PIG-L family deacetylase [Planctomycetota bacterium]